MIYDCLKKPFDQLNDEELDILSSYIRTWYTSHCDSILHECEYRGWLEERKDVDTVIRAFIHEFHMPDESLESVKAMFLQMVDKKQLTTMINQWYSDNCAIGRDGMRFKLIGQHSLPDEILNHMMQELNLPADKRDEAGKLLWQSYRDDFEMWCA